MLIIINLNGLLCFDKEPNDDQTFGLSMNSVNKTHKRVMTELEIGEIGSQRLSTKIPSCTKLSRVGTNIVLKNELFAFNEFFGASIRYAESIVSEVLSDSGFIS